MREVVIPYAPRPQQKQIHKSLDQLRFGVIVCHRRFGKTVLAVNQLEKGALTCKRPRPRFGYIAPTFRQAKAIAWDYLKFYADPIPGRVFNETELRADFPNGGQVRLFGADNPDSLRGIYLDGVVLDEYGLMRSNVFTEVIRPALSDRQGWALFAGTPNGKNQFYEIADHAKNAEGWFFQEFKASETGLLLASELAEARRVMTPEEYAQEYECSFEASVKGAIYGKELTEARDQGRITSVPYDPSLKVNTYWDLGINDPTAIWFEQTTKGGEVHLIDYYESSDGSVPAFVSAIQNKPYVYGKHFWPHDGFARELGSGRSPAETAKSLGLIPHRVPDLGVEDGIHAGRMLFPRVWIDAVKCKAGIEALMNYRRDYNQRLGEFKATPIHDWASHGSDGYRYLAVSLKEQKEKAKPQPVKTYTGSQGWMG